MNGTPVEWREEMLRESLSSLSAFAHRQFLAGKNAQQFLLVCIDVDDAYWRDLVEHLMPGVDWQMIREQGATPIARGAVDPELADFICHVCPEIAPAFLAPLPPRCARVAVLSHGVTIFHISAAEQEWLEV